ncbi:hypothetical protein PanWU01x14_061400, partial [Parasponia andersonii]
HKFILQKKKIETICCSKSYPNRRSFLNPKLYMYQPLNLKQTNKCSNCFINCLINLLDKFLRHDSTNITLIITDSNICTNCCFNKMSFTIYFIKVVISDIACKHKGNQP